jgi:antirestriction protein ArdC
LHDYSDLNHFESWRTRDLAADLGGEVWLTETGGVVKFADAFTNVHGSGVRRAARVLQYMFGVAASIPRIKRLYIYNWVGGTPSTRFDAGLTNAHYKPRPGYVVVCKQLHAAHCNVKTVEN